MSLNDSSMSRLNRPIRTRKRPLRHLEVVLRLELLAKSWTRPCQSFNKLVRVLSAGYAGPNVPNTKESLPTFL
eukprot:1276731-Amphidinium_carterae.1